MSYQLMVLLAGSLERADGVFTVSAPLPSPAPPLTPSLRHLSLGPRPARLTRAELPSPLSLQDLVAAIDITLQDVSSSLELRHRTLQLALVLVGGVGQGSLTAYFLRRDLFSTLVRFMADSNTAAFAYESVVSVFLR